MKRHHFVFSLGVLMLVTISCKSPLIPIKSRPTTFPMESTPVVAVDTVSAPPCDIVCRDATASIVLTLTPLAPATNSPEFYEQERQYIARLETVTAEARRMTPTTVPSATATATPRPAGRPGFALYQENSYASRTEPRRQFQIIYDTQQWQLADNNLKLQHIPGCTLHPVGTGGKGVLGPIVTDQVVLADYIWRRQSVVSGSSVFYALDFDDNYYLFELSLPENTPAETARQCQAAAEAVIATFDVKESVSTRVAPPSTPTAQPSPSPVAAVPAGTPGPLRPHYTTSIGTGVFAHVTYSDGLAPYTDDDVTTRFGRVEVSLSPVGLGGCWISRYNTDKVWFRSGAVGPVMVTVIPQGADPIAPQKNGNPVGVLNEPTGPHGYILDLDHPLQRDEWVCITVASEDGLYIIYGPDLYYWYDSYCSRKACN
ncbi:MAG: hypothetical protein AUK03_09445 [Anaerolineae bacterium CG2_30_64_16]|nr:MAG: hypothetical protein AUK03_09445 [Anaerolineae bacterium CG2_30_64_16]